MTLYSLTKIEDKYARTMNKKLMPLNTIYISNKTKVVEKFTELLENLLTECPTRESVYAEILRILKKYFPNCVLTKCKTSIKTSVVSNSHLNLLFLPFPDFTSTELRKSGKNELPPDPEKILSGETPRDNLDKLKDWSLCEFLKAVFIKEDANVEKVILCKNPILKIHFKNNKFICDLHVCSNMLVVFCSELLQFLEKIDPCIKPLVRILCYWAHSLGFIKKNFFTNKGFILLIVFYLQNTNPKILPPVQHLIYRAGFSRIYDGWQTAFTTDKRMVEEPKITKPWIELLMGFFVFYWNFDFVQNIVSPNLGYIFPVKSVKDSKIEKMKEFKILPINIQDPFVLSCNVCKVDNHTNTDLFKFSLLVAQKILQNIPEKFKFTMLFDYSEYQKVMRCHFTKYVIGVPKLCFINFDYDIWSHLCQNSNFSEQLWFEKVSTAVFDVLQYGILIECDITYKVNYGENVSNIAKPNSAIYLSNLELIQSVQCVVYSRTRTERETVDKIFVTDEDVVEFNNSVLKVERGVSRELIKKNPLLNQSVPLMYFNCDCYKHTCPTIRDVIVMLKLLTVASEFYSLSEFLSVYIPKTVKMMLLND